MEKLLAIGSIVAVVLMGLGGLIVFGRDAWKLLKDLHRDKE